MKHFLKLLALIGVIALSSIKAEAQMTSGSLASGVNLVRSGMTAIQSLLIANRGSTATYLEILDNDSDSTTNIVRPAWNVYSLTRATNSTTFTNAAGTVQTNDYVYLSRSTTSNAAVTNKANQVYTLYIAAGASVNLFPVTPIGVTRGVQIYATTATNVDYTMQYLGP